MKTCSTCKQAKTLSEFYVRKTGVIYYECKGCARANAKDWRDKNPERAKQACREWFAANPDKKAGYIAARRLKIYGLSQEQLNELRVRQNGRCLICGQAPKQNDLAVDHCHKTGRVRGLLCVGCNRGLGLFKDNPENLFRAWEYLCVS